MNQNLITDKVYGHIANAMKYLLAAPHDVQQAGVLWGYLLALLDVEAITVEQWVSWQSELSTAEVICTEDELTPELIKEILSCDEPREVLKKIWQKRKEGQNNG